MIKKILILLFLTGLCGLSLQAAHEKGSARLDLKDYTGANNIVYLEDNQINAVNQYVNPPFTPLGFFDHTYRNRLVLGIDRTERSVGTVSTVLGSGNVYSAEVDVSLSYNMLVGNSFVNVNIPCKLKVNYRGETTLVNVNNGAKETDLDAFVFNKGYISTAVITAVRIYNAANTLISTNNYPENLYLELQYDAERYYDLNTSNVSTNPFNSNSQFFIRYYNGPETGNQIELNWQRIPGAEEYDLEWLWVDEFSAAYTYTLTPFSNTYWSAFPILDFKNNSTRIRTDQNSYRISNVFEGGYVFFRVRGVGRMLTPAALVSLGNDPLTEIFTPWTCADQLTIPSDPLNFSPVSSITSIGPSPISGITVGGGVASGNVPWFIEIKTAGSTTLSMEPGKNWVYKATYAEEGKKKEIVSYFDGSQRNRQTVTINNSDKVAVVAESYYDYQGRPAVSALPTPVDDATIKFYQTTVNGINGFNFENVGTNPRPYTKTVFANGSGGACSNTETGFSSFYGTGRYYSGNNPFINSSSPFFSAAKYYPSYTPDAENFPYIKTEFVNDNSGRVARQGGAGSTLKIENQVGVNKHDTRYFYGVPVQEELDRLFGSEIGYANRYTKTTTIDANGQVSISYMNDEGKVVATALSGAKPASMDALTSSSGTDLGATSGVFLQVDLLNKTNSSNTDTPQDNNESVGDALVFNQKITVTAAQTYSFNYSLLGSNYTGCTNFCYDCVYDLTFDVRDKCGANPTGFTPVVYKLGKIVGTPPSITNTSNTDNTCGNDAVNFNFQQIITPGSNSLTVSLDVGEYTITKKLTVNQEALSTYLKSYIDNCAFKLADFTTAEAPNLDYTGCNMTCDQCVAALGTLANYLSVNNPIPGGGTMSTYQIDSLTAEYNNLKAECLEPCSYTSYCEAAFEMLLVDMSPAGQYADFEGPGNTIDPSQFPLSILNTANSLSKQTMGSGTPSWLTPEHYQKTGTAAQHYYDDDNITISKVQVTAVSGGGYQPPLASGVTPVSVGAQLFAEPHQLLNLSDFISSWKPSWSRSLVKFHPEFCYYEWCIKNSTVTLTSPVSISMYSINPVNGNPKTTDPPYTVNVSTSDAFDSLLVDVDELEDVVPGTSNANVYTLMDVMQNDPYWTTTGYYFAHQPTNNPPVPDNASNATNTGNVQQRQGSSATPVDFSGLSTTLYYPDKFNFKTANNRFWNFQGSGLNLYQFAAIVSTTLVANQGQSASALLNLLNNYTGTGIGYATPPGGSGFSNPSDYILQLQNLDERRKAWDFFKMMYLAMKQQLQQEAAESYVMNSDCRGCNGCIGKPDFNNEDIPFTVYSKYFLWQYLTLSFPNNFNSITTAYFKDWYTKSSTYQQNMKQHCGWYTAHLYYNKMKRFQTANDAKALDITGGNNTGANIYASTGLCPIAFYFQNFLNEMVQPGSGNSLLANNSNLTANAPSFVGDLYKEVTGGNITNPFAPASYTFVSSTGSSNTELFGTIKIGTYPLCTLKVVLPASLPSGYPSGMNNWSNYFGSPPTFTLTKFINLQATSANNFNVVLKIKTSSSEYTLAATGTTCMKLNGCSFSPPCQLTGTGKALKDLMNLLVTNNQLANTTGVAIGGSSSSTGSPYNSAFTNGLKPFLENVTPNSTTWTWQKNSGGNFFTIDDASGPTGNNKLKISFTPPSGMSLGCINAIQNFRADPAVQGGIIFDAYVNIPAGQSGGSCSSGSFVVTATVEIGPNLSATPLSSLTVGDCSFDLATCNTAEHHVKKDVEAFVMASTGSPFGTMISSSSQNITYNNLFTGLLRSYLGPATPNSMNSGTPPTVNVSQNYYHWLKDNTNSTTTETQGWFILSNSSSAPSSAPANACKFNLKYKNSPSTSLNVNAFNSLSGFTLVSSPTMNNNAYTFKVTGFYTGGAVAGDTLIGSSTCFPMRSCETATCMNPVSATSAPSTVLIEDFECTGNGFNLVDQNGNNYVQSCITNAANLTLANLQARVIPSNVNGVNITVQHVIRSCPQQPSNCWVGQNIWVSQKGLRFQNNESITTCADQPDRKSTFTKNFTMSAPGVYNFSMDYVGNMEGCDCGVNNCGVYINDAYEIFIDNNLIYANTTFNFYSGSGTLVVPVPGVLSSGVHTLKIVFHHHNISSSWLLDELKLIKTNDAPSYLPCTQATQWPQDTMPTVEYEEPCQAYLEDIVANAAQDKFEHYLDSIKSDFVRKYTKQCMSNAVENLLMRYNNNDYHFTLYYYDQAGNLVRTVPPEGVRLITPASTSNPNIYTLTKQERAAFPTAPTVLSSHILYTTYTYNSLNQLVKQETPDAGISEFYYDNLGRLTLSQNAEQKITSGSGVYNYDYTKYDELGRISQEGKLQTSADIVSTFGSGLSAALSAAMYPVNMPNASRKEVTQTYYGDAPNFVAVVAPAQFSNGMQQNLRGRIASLSIEDVYDGNDATYNHATHYSYDIHGNVKELIQDNPDMNGSFAAHRYKQICYQYDLISGRTRRVDYQLGKRDVFSHEYLYDAENRVTNVYTSRDGGYSWDQDAKYYYYLHGPRARTEIGHHKVQGMDYAFTVQGWIKGVNSNNLDANNDMGKDGYDDLNTSNSTTYIHNYAARDAFGYNLNYYASDAVDDYMPVDGNIFSNPATYAFAKLYNGGSYNPLYNSNVSSMGTGFLNLDATMSTIPNTSQSITKYATYSQLKQFKYDQMNRITHAAATSNYINGNNEWDYIGGGAVTQYSETFVYDQNGNIKSANRWGVQTNASVPTLDGLLYYYYTKTGGMYLPGSAPANATNKLAFVRDAIVSSATDDIENQSSGNYRYDANGNLITDTYEQIASISWTTYGKIKSIVRTGGSSKFSMDFKYDAMGNRVSKRTYKTSTDYTTTYYVRDAQGNVMATYEKDFQTSAPAITLKLKELNIYGNERLGNLTTDYLLATTGSGGTVPSLHARTLGNKNYELTNHLGNVLAVVTDRKLQVDANADGTTDYFMPDMLNTTDYYAFGAPMGGGRKYTVANRYRYGFNGKENDPEAVSTGEGTQDYGMRIYNPSLGKFLSVDPITNEYPSLTPYQFASNSPIIGVDKDGLELDRIIERVVTRSAPLINNISIPSTIPVPQTVSIPGLGSINTWDFPYEKLNMDNRLVKELEKLDPDRYLVYLWTRSGFVKDIDQGYDLWLQVRINLRWKFKCDMNEKAKLEKARLEMTKKGPKDLVGEAKEQKAKEEKAAEREAKRKAQTNRGNKREGNSNQSTKGSHHSGKKGGDKHSNGDARRAADQGVKGPDTTK